VIESRHRGRGVCHKLGVNYEDVMEKEWGNAFVHESGHALVAVLKNIPCHGIYYEFLADGGKFCALANLPEQHADLSADHYIFLGSGSAAEQLIYGKDKQDESTARGDKSYFTEPTAPSFDQSVSDALAILTAHKRHVKRLVSKLKARMREADYDVGRLPVLDMQGSTRKYAVLLSKQELEDAVQKE
jgi:hypothetical protein